MDTAFKNTRENSDRENARIEHDKALGQVMTNIMKNDTELFRQLWITKTSSARCEVVLLRWTVRGKS